MKKTKLLTDDVSYDWWLTISQNETWAFANNIFNDEEIDLIHKVAKNHKIKNGRVGSGPDTRDDDNVRDSGICFFNSSDVSNNWIFHKISQAVYEINQQFWNFDINRIETLQYTVYNEGQYYKDHVDMMYQGPNRAVRKLSFTIQLTDENDYEGGDLLFKTSQNTIPGKRTKGTIMFFPSYVLHEVTTVTKGTRVSLVGWVTGPSFK